MTIWSAQRQFSPLLGRGVLSARTWPARWRLPLRSSLLVVGPTQSGKTSSLVIPAILRWRGPVVVTSVKTDVARQTETWRGALGEICVIDPSRDAGLTWDPLEGLDTMRQALAIARDLVVSSKERTSSESDFWNSLAVKSLAAVALVMASRGGTIFDVRDVIERRDLESLRFGSVAPEADQLLAAFGAMEPKTQDAVCTTMETMLLPWQVRQPLASIRHLLNGEHTLYLCAPRADHRHYEGLFRGALRTIIEEQERRANSGIAPPLLLVLDEAASIAPLDDLDQLAATVSGLNITLVTVFQDFAQIRARWGDKAATVVNNHTTRVVIGGLVDPIVSELLPSALPATEHDATPSPDYLRRLPRARAIVISGRRPRAEIRLRPWFHQRHLKWRGRQTT